MSRRDSCGYFCDLRVFCFEFFRDGIEILNCFDFRCYSLIYADRIFGRFSRLTVALVGINLFFCSLVFGNATQCFPELHLRNSQRFCICGQL